MTVTAPSALCSVAAAVTRARLNLRLKFHGLAPFDVIFPRHLGVPFDRAFHSRPLLRLRLYMRQFGQPGPALMFVFSFIASLPSLCQRHAVCHSNLPARAVDGCRDVLH